MAARLTVEQKEQIRDALCLQVIYLEARFRMQCRDDPQRKKWAGDVQQCEVLIERFKGKTLLTEYRRWAKERKFRGV